MRNVAFDVCVLGGGPAGTSAALRLAQLGHRVALIERANVKTSWDESVAPSIAPMLHSLGLTRSLAGRALLRPARKRSLWAERAESVQEDGTLIIERRGFDRLLRDAAAGTGVTHFLPATARRAVAGKSGWMVEVETQSKRLRVAARFLIDGRGRCGTGSQFGPPTAALCGRWRADGVPHKPEMLVDVVPNGWIWGATRPDRSVRVLAFVDTQDCAGLGRAEREKLYRTMLAGSSLIADFPPTELLGGVAVRDSTWRIADQIVTPRSIKVGDRAFAMDPLSSQGVQAALRSGIQAAAVVHTILSDGDVDASLQFYRQSHAAAVAHHRRVVRAAFAAQTRYRTLFWSQRASGIEPEVEPSTPVVMPAPDAFLHLAADVRIVDAPVINGNEICRQPALVHPSLDRPMAWLGGVPIATIIGAVKSRMTVAELLSENSEQPAPAATRAALSWLLARGIVTAHDGVLCERPSALPGVARID